MRRPLPTLFIVMVVLFLIAACASSGAAVGETVGSAIGGNGGRDASGDNGAGPLPAASGAPGVVDDNGQAIGQREDALIVRTGSVAIEVADFDAAVAKARTVVTGLGGYISGSQMATDGDLPYASITYRIPSDRWDDALAALKALGTKVLNEQTQAVEVTTAVIDLDARIENLRATERSLQAIMAQATKIPDILEVQGQLTNVRGEIERLTAESTHLRDQASYGTLTVGWSMPVVAVAEVQGSWDPAAIVDEALAQLVQLGQGVFTAGIWLTIVGVPLLLVGLVLFGLAAFVARRLGLGRRQVAPTEANANT
ncbi:MAG: DUF4349 domain-containing protein [Candidatus Limnocylindrales bacterium]